MNNYKDPDARFSIIVFKSLQGDGLYLFDWVHRNGFLMWLDQRADYYEVDYKKFREKSVSNVIELAPFQKMNKGIDVEVHIQNKTVSDWLRQNPGKTKNDFTQIIT